MAEDPDVFTNPLVQEPEDEGFSRRDGLELGDFTGLYRFPEASVSRDRLRALFHFMGISIHFRLPLVTELIPGPHKRGGCGRCYRLLLIVQYNFM
jgi:hypothetical protein